MKLLLVGASGLVGGHLLDLALSDPRITSVVALTRRARPIHDKLEAPIVDFDTLDQTASWWSADAVICTLGTTMLRAGSQAAFRRVDHDYPLAVARLAHAHGTPIYVLNSAIGADADSRFFYNRVKGELENALASVGFRSLTFVRPGVIGGGRLEFRAGERLLVAALSLLGPMLPKRLRLNPAGRIAQALLEAALRGEAGRHIVKSDRLT
ncbi:NAD-dependent epimerase/dehydratase family protein [Agrobacterium tumefaciens]|uniref:NAD(P)H-binding protein n=1 Tax=Agrobacterium tumefaciens TaxID=358 RepID=UPI0012B6FA12|nr:NAD(P)H-binding protein [Agrobacterium tumefaciens]MQB07287.1 NAD-dependent epimerase/dehydratase family protein [Agrobacterium tumefaciens]